MELEKDRNEPLRIGIIGAGALGQIIGSQFRPLFDATITAVTDVNNETLTTAGKELGVDADAQFSDYETMLAETNLDGVVITTPHALHDEQITAALDEGLHVLCEKPLVLSATRAKELGERVADSSQVLMVGYQRHLDRSFQRARKRYSEGDRDVRFVTAEITQNWTGVFEGSWRMNPTLSGGGFLCDTGRHVVDAVLWTTGIEPVAVNATVAFERPNIDHTAQLRIECESGTIVALSLFGDAQAVRETHHFWDDDGAAIINGRGWGDRDLTLVDGDDGTYKPLLDQQTGRNKAEAFLDSINGKAAPPATPLDAYRATAVVEAAYKSAETGERVPVEL